ncbi:MAG TPA: BamA/TamA family outer membrane protein [Steroidobacteraceae bacterium]|jgi:outer membrane protein assembly factor BamA|nr:BamA/TamA family outer membrane protein [Steroidobacteraceae bacterium]
MKLSDGCRLLGFAVLAAAISEPGLAAKFTDQEHTRIEEPRPADVPSDSELEAAGAIIGKVELDIRNIFDQTDPRETNGLFRLANRLHIRTKRASIQAQLLFASGDIYRARKLAETERALRLLSYIYDARIVPVHYADGKVDIKVITKDVWTLSPGLSFGRAGGSNSTNFNLQDTNFLGWGKALQVSHGSTVDRTSNTVAWADPNVFGSKWTSAAAYVGSSDGTERVAQIAHPFYSLDTAWSTQITAVKYDRTISRYNLGEKVDQFNDNESSYELSGGLSNGLVDGWTKRLTFGVRYDRNLFLPTPGTGIPARQLPPDRTLSYPFVGFDILEDKYQKIGDENQIGRTEDLYFGTEVSGEMGWVNSAFGADRNAVLLRAHLLRGMELTELQQIFITSNFTSRIEDGQARNLIADAGAKYYWRWRTDWLLYAELSGTVTDSLDPDLQVLLGGDNGLRGYPLRYESGTSRALLTVEQRFYTDWYPFRLVRVGGAIFADVGRTWGSGVIGNSDPGLLRDVGFGLRIGNTRSGLGNVLHIDFAFPLNHIAGIKPFQFLVQTMQSF